MSKDGLGKPSTAPYSPVHVWAPGTGLASLPLDQKIPGTDANVRQNGSICGKYFAFSLELKHIMRMYQRR